MGADSYYHIADYRDDLQAVLDELRQTVFAHGEYGGAELRPSTIDEALEFAGMDGTASILDVSDIRDIIRCDDEELEDITGTSRPTVDQAATLCHADELWDYLERGEARYILLYQDDQPAKILFYGLSVD